MCRAPQGDISDNQKTDSGKKGTVASTTEDRICEAARLQNEMQQESSPLRWPKRLALAMIRFYQNAISPHTPPTCFFYPTCSHYTYQAIERFGFWRGLWLGMCRIVRCHPFAHGGYDPVPEKFLWFRERRRVESHKDLDE